MNCCSKSGISWTITKQPNSHSNLPQDSQVVFQRFSWPWRRRLPYCAMCSAIVGGGGPASVSFRLSLSTEELAPCAKGFSQALLFRANSSSLWYQVPATRLSESSESSSWCDGTLRCFSINPPRYASLSRTWDVDAASNELGSLLIPLSGFPESVGISGLLDSIGLDAAEELVAIKEEDIFITAGRDLDTTLSSSF